MIERPSVKELASKGRKKPSLPPGAVDGGCGGKLVISEDRITQRPE